MRNKQIRAHAFPYRRSHDTRKQSFIIEKLNAMMNEAVRRDRDRRM